MELVRGGRFRLSLEVLEAFGFIAGILAEITKVS
jgi:hypothetical protein